MIPNERQQFVPYGFCSLLWFPFSYVVLWGGPSALEPVALPFVESSLGNLREDQVGGLLSHEDTGTVLLVGKEDCFLDGPLYWVKERGDAERRRGMIRDDEQVGRIVHDASGNDVALVVAVKVVPMTTSALGLMAQGAGRVFHSWRVTADGITNEYVGAAKAERREERGEDGVTGAACEGAAGKGCGRPGGFEEKGKAWRLRVVVRHERGTHVGVSAVVPAIVGLRLSAQEGKGFHRSQALLTMPCR